MKINLSSLFKKQNLFLIVVLLIGGYLRLAGVFSNSFAFTYDVGRDMLALWNIVHTHKLLLIGFTTGLPGVFYGPWYYYLLLIPYILSFGNPQGLALTMALAGIATIIFGFFLGKKIGGNFLGISLASFITVSPNLVSSQIWNPNLVPITLMLLLLVLHKLFSEEKPKAVYYFIFGFLLALIIDLEIVFGILLAIGLILAFLLIKNKKIQLKSIISFFIGALVIFSPRIIFEFRHHFLMTTSFIKFITTSDASQNPNLLGTIIDRMTMLFNQFNSVIASDNKYLGAILLLFIFLAIILFYKKTAEISKKFIKTSLIVLLTFLLGLTFFHHDIWPHYLVGLPIFYILLFCLAVNLLVKKTGKNTVPILIIVVLFLINLHYMTIVNHIGKPLFIGDASVYRNQLTAIDYVYQQAEGKPFKYVVYTSSVYDYSYQYLFEWYGPNKYHYAPSNDAHLAYFILEPDTQYAFRLTDWLKLREGDGKIIKTETLRSGIIIQTRIH